MEGIFIRKNEKTNGCQLRRKSQKSAFLLFALMAVIQRLIGRRDASCLSEAKEREMSPFPRLTAGEGCSQQVSSLFLDMASSALQWGILAGGLLLFVAALTVLVHGVLVARRPIGFAVT